MPRSFLGCSYTNVKLQNKTLIVVINSSKRAPAALLRIVELRFHPDVGSQGQGHLGWKLSQGESHERSDYLRSVIEDLCSFD